ncbi:hypothetical protein NQ156_05410 [Microbacterium sp. zg.Y625]|uniref:hypothetical protein n=1 Tax=Microbacterium jiangjiandongii TaxID=3049071 RepID=UPI00214BB75C|nr:MULTISPECIES: hypothetical protein [unclassified Microbacterium]MCR2792499.1 hypothetical protein [Microbacterium sp. zg.Y625]WIM26490.1 hypothetical protein QNO14_05435 [Microbacterium sp. zg-Y625]
MQNTGSSVELGADYTAGGGHGGGGGRDNSDDAVAPGTGQPAPAPVCNPVVGCRGGYQVWAPPEVTISDLAAFTPARPTFTAEPDGVAVRGMPANFVASATEQHIAGELFDHPVVVRFVPAAFVFHYGDGSSRTSSTGGATWPTLGQAQFTATATSHAYGERGDYAASVTVRYSASVDFGTGSWRDVPGFVESTTGGYGVRVVEVHTALVDRTCLEDPTGPGC